MQGRGPSKKRKHASSNNNVFLIRWNAADGFVYMLELQTTRISFKCNMSKNVVWYADDGPQENACNVMFTCCMQCDVHLHVIANVFWKKQKLDKDEIKAVDGLRRPSNRNKKFNHK